MNHNIIYAEKGDPWQFPLIYKVTSYTVRFMDLHHFGKEGPLCGKLFINGLQIAAPHYEGFGGPIIIKGKYISLSLSNDIKYQVKLCKSFYSRNRCFKKVVQNNRKTCRICCCIS